MAVLGRLLGVAVQHVAGVLADDVGHLHDAHERGEGAVLVDVGALAEAQDVLELAVLERGRVHVQEAVAVAEAARLDEGRGFAGRVDEQLALLLGRAVLEVHGAVGVVQLGEGFVPVRLHFVEVGVVLDDAVVLGQGVVGVGGVGGGEAVVDGAGPGVDFVGVDAVGAAAAEAEVRVVEVLADELALRRVGDEGRGAMALAVEAAVHVPGLVLEVGRVAQCVAHAQAVFVLRHYRFFQALDRVLVFVQACRYHQNFLFNLSSIF